MKYLEFWFAPKYRMGLREGDLDDVVVAYVEYKYNRIAFCRFIDYEDDAISGLSFRFDYSK